MPMSNCRICPRCSMPFLNGVAYPSRTNQPASNEWVAKKVCQYAHAQDDNGKEKANGCINPQYDKSTEYGSVFDDADLLHDLNKVFTPLEEPGDDPSV
jgi:hypothetical protein